MSDSLITEIVEITDSSITLSKAESGLEESNKRRLSNDDESGKESVSGKKICRETDNFVRNGNPGLLLFYNTSIFIPNKTLILKKY